MAIPCLILWTSRLNPLCANVTRQGLRRNATPFPSTAPELEFKDEDAYDAV